MCEWPSHFFQSIDLINTDGHLARLYLHLAISFLHRSVSEILLTVSIRYERSLANVLNLRQGQCALGAVR